MLVKELLARTEICSWSMKKVHARVNSQWCIHDMLMKFLINNFSCVSFISLMSCVTFRCESVFSGDSMTHPLTTVKTFDVRGAARTQEV